MSHNNRNTSWWSDRSYPKSCREIILPSDDHVHNMIISFEGLGTTITAGRRPFKLEIKKVIFNHPATIVYWADGSKTVVKAQDDEPFDKEKGMAMAIAKKALGDEGNYYNEFKKWISDEV